MSMWTPSSPSGNKKKSTFNPLGNIVPAKPAKAAAPRTQTQLAAINAGRAAAPKTFSGPLIDPKTGASQVDAYVASQQGGGGGGVGNGTGQVEYGAQTADNPAPMAPDLSEDALRKSAEYLARERAIQAMLNEFNVKQGTDKTRYEENYGKSLSELGYDPTSSKFDLGELLTSGQRATTSGKAYNALRNDFAARGMLQSGAYQAAQGVLRDQLMKQREAIDTQRTRFLEDQNTALLGQQAQAEEQRKAALEAARQSILNSMGV